MQNPRSRREFIGLSNFYHVKLGRKEYNESYGKVFEKNHGMINSAMQAAWFLEVLEEDGKRTLVSVDK